MTSLEERIIQFTAEQIGVHSEKVGLSSRLFHDLKMDGYDAVLFFEAYGREFHVDLTDLHHTWDQHFGPEGGSVALLLPLVAGGLIALVLGEVVRRTVALLSGITFSIGVICLWTWYCYKRTVPITVTDLIKSAEAGTWVRDASAG